MAASREFKNRLARERIGNDPEKLAERIAGVDRSKYDLDGYSDQEINMALQGKFGDEDYARLTGGKKDSGSNDSKKPANSDSSGNESNDIGYGSGRGSGYGYGKGIPNIDLGFNGFEGVDMADAYGSGVDSSFSVGGDLTQNIGKEGDMNTDITNSTFGPGAEIGNDGSLTVGRQNAGNSVFGTSLSNGRRAMAKEGAFAGLRFT